MHFTDQNSHLLISYNLLLLPYNSRRQKDYLEEIKKIMTEYEEILEKQSWEKMNALKHKMEALERGNTQNNVVVQGLKVETRDQDELKEEITKCIDKNIGIDVNVKTAKRLGYKTCIIEL